MIQDDKKTLIMLVSDVHRQFGHKIRELEKHNEYGSSVNCILFELHKHGNLTQVELVDKIHMRPSSISVALQKMELDGLIERKVKDDDQRYSVVCITSKGKKSCEEMKKKIFELDNSFTSQLDKEELEIAKKVLIKLNNIFKGDSNENI